MYIYIPIRHDIVLLTYLYDNMNDVGLIDYVVEVLFNMSFISYTCYACY